MVKSDPSSALMHVNARSVEIRGVLVKSYLSLSLMHVIERSFEGRGILENSNILICIDACY
jgi:hypothetical protein